jgi:hypothetical protein
MRDGRVILMDEPRRMREETVRAYLRIYPCVLLGQTKTRSIVDVREKFQL